MHEVTSRSGLFLLACCLAASEQIVSGGLVHLSQAGWLAGRRSDTTCVMINDRARAHKKVQASRLVGAPQASTQLRPTRLGSGSLLSSTVS